MHDSIALPSSSNPEIHQGHGTAIAARCAAFTRFLRDQGIPTVPAQTVTLLHCLEIIDVTDRALFRDAARAVYVQRREHLALFDLAFDRFWQASLLGPPRPGGLLEDRRSAPAIWTLEAVTAGENETTSEASEDRASAYSAAETLRQADFATLTAAEETALLALLRGNSWRLPLRRTRRLAPDSHGDRIDLRRSLRHAVAHGGDLVPLARRQRRSRPRPLVLLCDVSGSMERYTRLLLQFVYALAAANERVETFLFSTQLTRVTRQLRGRNPGPAIAQAIAAARDAGGGTRIGQALRTFNVEWARRVRSSGAVVLVISDGCDRGDPTLLAAEMARLHRSCHRLLWLNPWLGQADYQPTVRGMAAALPYVDAFLPAHNLTSLEQLMHALES